MNNLLLGMPHGAEWFIILAIVILVFGAAKLPELARGTGQALRIFKSETKGLKDDDDTTGSSAAPTASTAELPAAPQAPATPSAPPAGSAGSAGSAEQPVTGQERQPGSGTV